MNVNSSIPKMIGQSRTVLISPSVENFERYEKDGSLFDALIYVAIASAITGAFGLSEGVGGFIRNILVTLFGFFVFTYLVHLIGKRQGGTGSLDEVAYTFALFWAPLSVIFSLVTLILAVTLVGLVLLPLVALAALAFNVFFAFLAVQSSMNLEAGSTTLAVLLMAAFAAFIVNMLVTGIFL